MEHSTYISEKWSEEERDECISLEVNRGLTEDGMEVKRGKALGYIRNRREKWEGKVREGKDYKKNFRGLEKGDLATRWAQERLTRARIE